MLRKKIIIIGAGPGGLAAAMILAKRGFNVQLFEKDSVIGGRNARLEAGAYRFDLGPTFLMMKYLLDELFVEAGRKSSDYLDCLRLDPMYRLSFADKDLVVTGDLEKMKANIEQAFPGESNGLDKFYEREGKRFRALYPCLQRTYSGLGDFLSLTLIKAFPHLSAGRSLYDVLSTYFKAEELRLAFTFQSKYLGMSPWDCPGLFAMIPYTEHAHGVYHVQGGLSEISLAFAKIALEEGASIHLSREVKKLRVVDGFCKGVEFPDGSFLEADEVLVNADFGYAVEHLFPSSSRKKWTPKKLKKIKFSCSTFMIYLGLDKLYDCEHHAIFFANDYKENLKDISSRLRLSDDFSVYVRNASINDASLAPVGHSALYVLVPVPNLRSEVDWATQRNAFRDKIYDFLETRTPYKDLRKHVIEERIITPLDWQEKKAIYEGATFNMGHQLGQLLHLRPHNKFEDFENCYLVGGGTHPGSGLPTIFESARIAANLVSKKYGIAYLAPKPVDELDFFA